MRRLFLIASLGALALSACAESTRPDSGFDVAAFVSPPASARPWVRWWWPGNDVDPAALARDVASLAAAGFGGVEIQAFDAGLNPNAPADELARRRSVWSPSFYDHLKAALDAAKAAGLSVDLTLGSGWATGGDHVAPENSLLTLAFSEQRATGPGPVSVPLDGPDLTPFYKVAGPLDAGGDKLARWRPELAWPVVVLAARVTGGERAANWLTLDDQLQLDPASVTVVEASPTAGQTVAWTAPEGDWVVLAFYGLPDGEYPNFNAQPEPGWVVDHLDAQAVTETLETLLGSAAGLDAYHGSPLTGLFVDSFELKVERFFSRDFLSEFTKRRGYDPTLWLPVVMVPGADNNLFDGGGLPAAAPFEFSPADPSTSLGAGDRVRHDWQQTASDLFVERFAGTVQGWAAARGMGLRMQAYGLNVDVLAAMGASAVPEVEQLYAGGTDLFLKMGSSAAHLYGKTVCSAESFVWPGKDGYETPALWKAAADKLLVAGVTRLVYHGFATQPSVPTGEFGWLGWHPFSNPYSGLGTYGSLLQILNDAPTMKTLNAYVARVQAALGQGQPDADVLVLYPWLGFPASWTRLTGRDELLFNGRFAPDDPDPASSGAMALVTQVFGEPVLGPRGEWLEAVEPLLDGLHAAGYAWDWTNEERLRVAVAEDGKIRIGDVTWKAVLLVDVPGLEPDTARHLADLAAQGVPVAVVGALPVQQPGLGRADTGDAAVADAMATLVTGPRVRQVAPGDLASSLEADLGVVPGVRFWPDSAGLRHVRRTLPAGELVFFSNPTRASVATAVELPAGCESPAWLDPTPFMAGTDGVAREVAVDAGGRLALHLGAYGSALLLCGGSSTKLLPAREVAVTLSVDDWSVVGPDGTAVPLAGLPDPRRTADAGPYGSITYRGRVSIPNGAECSAGQLDLGWVDGRILDLRAGRAEDLLPLLPAFSWDDHVPGATLAMVGGGAAVTESATGGLAEADPTAPICPFEPGENVIELTVFEPLANRLRDTSDPHAARYADRPLAPFGLRGPVTLTLYRPVSD